ncbi:MAG: type II toxin-antitoxin system VapC family toxin [Taibaiella sp.]|nr:type II toxin-antitoxin system VapC family toxin [Taibaiella sp.]
MVKLFLDANVLLDFLLQREGYNNAKSLVENILGGAYAAYTTSSVIHIVAYWLEKYYSRDETKRLLLSLLQFITIIDTTHTQIVKAVQSDMEDVEDAILYYTAIANGMDYFITNDKELIRHTSSLLPIYLPSKFLKESGS